VIVHFFEPPPAQKAGGLDLGLRLLEKYLQRAGVTVRINSRVDELGESDGKEIVHFHGLWQPIFAKVSMHCRRAQIPYIVSPHGMLEPWARRHKRWKKWLWFHLVERRHLAGAARLLATSDAEADNLRELFLPEKCLSIPLALTGGAQPDYAAARRTLGWGDSEVVLLFLSRIHPKKGLHVLLPALAQLDFETIRRVRLVIVGGGEESYLHKLKDFARRQHARLPQVDWVGEIWGDGKWVYFQGADLFCLPSFSENFGLAVLEALQVGTRVLTTNQTPWDAVTSWGAGFVVEPAIGAVRSALARFLACPEWPAEQRTNLAADIHRRFSWDAIGPLYLRFYEDLLRSRAYVSC